VSPPVAFGRDRTPPRASSLGPAAITLLSVRAERDGGDAGETIDAADALLLGLDELECSARLTVGSARRTA